MPNIDRKVYLQTEASIRNATGSKQPSNQPTAFTKSRIQQLLRQAPRIASEQRNGFQPGWHLVRSSQAQLTSSGSSRPWSRAAEVMMIQSIVLRRKTSSMRFTVLAVT